MMNENQNINNVNEELAENIISEQVAEEITADPAADRNNISRYKMREQAVLLCFERLFTDSDIDEIAENLIDSRDIYLSDYAIKITKTIEEMVEEIDAIISAHLSKGWKISRISRISLALLRVAVYEMKYEEGVPVSVAINEAVELAKKYSADDASFINGVLGAVAKELG